MSEFNKIFPKSSVTLTAVTMSTLCFIDGVNVFSDKYSLTADRFDIYKQSNDSVNLFYNYNESQVYEYKLVLNNSGVIVSGKDLDGDILSDLTSDNIMIFINGKLLSKDQYLVLNSNEVALLYCIPQNTFQQVLIYRSNNPITYKKIILTDSQYLLNNDPSDSSIIYVDKRKNEFISQLIYHLNSSIIFINGKKLDNIYLEVEDNRFKINKELKDSDLIEFYDLGNGTESLNFYSTFGYTTFNYKDSNQKKIPLLYNCIATFDDIAKYVIDNINTGFFIKENIDGGGVAVIVDNIFETPNIKCFASYDKIFQKNNYYYNEYYIEVPDVKSITNYLADYDKQYPFLPEVLEVFQQTLLKEVYDSINRIRDIRSISRVDSYHINKLISLLGMDVNIKTLPLKKRHELLEELDNWYRIVGTKDSINIFNILQDDLKILKIDPLFTYSYSLSETETSGFYSYNYYSPSGGSNFNVYDRLEFKVDLENGSKRTYGFTITGINSSGAITELDPDVEEGEIFLTGLYHLTPQNLNLSTNITTSYYRFDYNYNYNISASSVRFTVGQELYTEDNKYRFKVTSINSSGQITGKEVLKGPLTGTTRVTENNLPLIITTPNTNLKLNVTSSISSESLVLSTSSNPGTKQSLVLQPGIYRYEMSGGGGSGATGDTGHGANGDIPVEAGKSAELATGTFTVKNISTLDYYIGAGGVGGRAALAKWWDYSYTASYGGVGWQSGANGEIKHYRPWSFSEFNGWYQDEKGARLVVAGAGGGSSRIYVPNSIDKIAKGGQGGGWSETYISGKGRSYSSGSSSFNRYRNAGGETWSTAVVNGGLGGGGGVSGTGAAGGDSAYGKGDFWGRNGSNGWIKVWKQTFSYSSSISGSGSGVNVNDEFKTSDNQFTVKVTSISGSSITGYTLTPADNSFSVSNTYDLNLVKSNQTAKLNVSSTLTKKTASYTIDPLSGLTNYLYVGARFNTSFSQLGFQPSNPEDGPVNFNLTGEVTRINRSNGNIEINWTYPDTSVSPVTNFNNTPINVSLITGTGDPTIRVSSSTAVTKYSEQEYVDFFTKEEKGAIPHSEYVYPHEDYGKVTDAVTNRENYGELYDEVDNTPNYGKITDKIKGEWIQWWEWDRKSIWYPTNHVSVEIKIESSDNAENIIERFIEQFYQLTSTVLYLHRLTTCYFFGNTTQDVSSGITSIDKAPICIGIQTTSTVSSETVVITSDPNRQQNTDNLPSTLGTVVEYETDEGTASIYQIVFGDPENPLSNLKINSITYKNYTNATTDETRTLTYKSSNSKWKDSITGQNISDISVYGITFNGTPKDKDSLLIHYVKLIGYKLV